MKRKKDGKKNKEKKRKKKEKKKKRKRNWYVRVLSPNQRKAMVLQICFNQDKSLSNMKFNEDEQNCK